MKNNLVVGLDDRQIKHLSGTCEGKKHDKKILDEEGVRFPDGIALYQDTGFQGHAPENITVHQPKKKPPNSTLSDADKERNRLISSVRIAVEPVIAGVRRCHIVKDVFRNTKQGYEDVVMELACGLHNYRSYRRSPGY